MYFLCFIKFPFLPSDMEVSVVSTNDFTGYTFPDPSSNLNITDSIKVPSEIFTNSVAGNSNVLYEYSLLQDMTSLVVALVCN